jgi:hypothetical protein
MKSTNGGSWPFSIQDEGVLTVRRLRTAEPEEQLQKRED